ncbi:non-specific serine/threonine protein kinase [Ranunculus cassubicifolius]
MATSLSFILMLLFSYTISFVTAQRPLPTNTTDFSCAPDSPRSCSTYVLYRAQSPEFLNVGAICDLFGVSPQSIQQANSLISEETQFVPGQQLLIPISCGCTGNNFSANISYEIKKGDNFYLLSVNTFENLTDYHVIEDMNPTLTPTLLHIGTQIVLPIFCKCPTKDQSDVGIKFLLTYIWQPHDDLEFVSSMLKANSNDIRAVNNFKHFGEAVGLPVLIPEKELPNLSLLPYPKKYKGRRILNIALWSAAGGFFSIVSCLMILAYCKYYKRKSPIPAQGLSLENIDLIQLKKGLKKEEIVINPRTMQEKLLPGVSGYLGKTIIYETKVIMEATMNLSELYRIGDSVYKAWIKGDLLAIKKTRENVTEELKILQKVNHANLVKLVGTSMDTDGNCFLVYEFAENGSLDKWLYSKSLPSSSSVSFLTWTQRLNIALDVATGLQYMHEHAQPSIVHMDIRSSNILLDSKFKAKIANLSMARTVCDSVIAKADVFAFGVVLLELLSGKKAMQTKDGGQIGMLWKELRVILEVEEGREERLRQWIDPNLEDLYPSDGAMSLAILAKACTWDKSSARPSMGEVVFNLSVLTHSSGETLKKSWTHGIEAEDSMEVISPVKAR